MTGQFCPVFIIDLCLFFSFFPRFEIGTSFILIDLYLEIPQWRFIDTRLHLDVIHHRLTI